LQASEFSVTPCSNTQLTETQIMLGPMIIFVHDRSSGTGFEIKQCPGPLHGINPGDEIRKAKSRSPVYYWSLASPPLMEQSIEQRMHYQSTEQTKESLITYVHNVGELSRPGTCGG
jgi:hypothetical protein